MTDTTDTRLRFDAKSGSIWHAIDEGVAAALVNTATPAHHKLDDDDAAGEVALIRLLNAAARGWCLGCFADAAAEHAGIAGCACPEDHDGIDDDGESVSVSETAGVTLFH